MKRVVLSTALLLEDGTFKRTTISQEEAVAWVAAHAPDNFHGHSTVKLLGLSPDTQRRSCKGYDEALCIRAVTRLEHGKDYSLEELQELGVELECVLVTRV